MHDILVLHYSDPGSVRALAEHIAGAPGNPIPTENESRLAFIQGQHISNLAKKSS